MGFGSAPTPQAPPPPPPSANPPTMASGAAQSSAASARAQAASAAGSGFAGTLLSQPSGQQSTPSLLATPSASGKTLTGQ